MMMFNLVECADKCLGQQWRFPISSGNKVVTYLSALTRCTLYSQLAFVRHGMNILTSNCMLLLILAASSLTDDFEMHILGHIIGRFFGSVAVD